MQKYEEAEEHYQFILKNKLTNNHIELAYCYHGLAQVNDKKGDTKSAIQNIQIALDYLLKNSPKHDHPLISQCYNHLGSVHNKQGDYLIAMNFYEKALTTINNITSNTYLGLGKIQLKLQIGNRSCIDCKYLYGDGKSLYCNE
jgi:tetratricopeptide (TPR) repeat protein